MRSESSSPTFAHTHRYCWARPVSLVLTRSLTEATATWRVASFETRLLDPPTGATHQRFRHPVKPPTLNPLLFQLVPLTPAQESTTPSLLLELPPSRSSPGFARCAPRARAFLDPVPTTQKNVPGGAFRCSFGTLGKRTRYTCPAPGRIHPSCRPRTGLA